MGHTPGPGPAPEPGTETSLSPGVYQGPIEITEDGASLIGSCNASGKPVSIIEGSVTIRASNVEVACIEARNGGHGIGVFGPGVENVTVRDFVTRDTTSSGIAIWGSDPADMPADYAWNGVTNVRILNGEVINAVDGGWQEKITVTYGVDGCEIAGVRMYDTRPLDGTNGGEGLDLKEGVSNCRIHHNDLGPVHRSSTIYIDAGNGWNVPDGVGAPTHRNIEIDHNIVRDDYAALVISTEGRGGADGIHVHHNEVISDTHLGISLYENPSAEAWAGQHGATPGVLRNITIEANRSRGGWNTADIELNNARATGVVVRDNDANLGIAAAPAEYTATNNARGVAVNLSGVGLEGLGAFY